MTKAKLERETRSALRIALRVVLLLALVAASFAFCLWRIGVPLDHRALDWAARQTPGDWMLLMFFMAMLMTALAVMIALIAPLTWHIAKRELFPIELPLNRIWPHDRGPPENWPPHDGG